MADQSTPIECPACKRMVESRVHCKHCNAHMEPELWYKNKPAPVQLPEADETICARLLFACNGHPHALIPWPHRLLHDAVAHISAQARRLAEAEAELAEVRSRNGMLAVQRADAVHLAKANPTQAYQRIQQFKERAEAAEARVRELVAEAAKRPLASDDEQTIADLEAFKARVMAWARGRCGACGHEGSEGDTCYDCNSDDERSNWTPPQAWEVGE